jgi:hypothetical protein
VVDQRQPLWDEDASVGEVAGDQCMLVLVDKVAKSFTGPVRHPSGK